MIIIIMGVSGVGKSTAGALLAERLGWSFRDADDYHPESNIQKIKNGIPLTDDDRLPWLETLRELIRAGGDPGIVLACSALKQSYRDFLRDGREDVAFIYLKGEKELIEKRLEGRRGHFAGPGILESQLRDLEEPEDAIVIDASRGPQSIADDIIGVLGLKPSGA
jgi:gluconokinase